MSLRTETVEATKQIGVYFCDHCDARIGEAPITDHGGYFVACSLAAKGDHDPLWHATICSDCMKILRSWTLP